MASAAAAARWRGEGERTTPERVQRPGGDVELALLAVDALLSGKDDVGRSCAEPQHLGVVPDRHVHVVDAGHEEEGEAVG